MEVGKAWRRASISFCARIACDRRNKHSLPVPCSTRCKMWCDMYTFSHVMKLVTPTLLYSSHVISFHTRNTDYTHTIQHEGYWLCSMRVKQWDNLSQKMAEHSSLTQRTCSPRMLGCFSPQKQTRTLREAGKSRSTAGTGCCREFERLAPFSNLRSHSAHCGTKIWERD